MKHDFLYYQPKWKGRKLVRHFVAALAIGSLSLSLSSTSGLGLFFPVAPTTLTNWAFGLIYREV